MGVKKDINSLKKIILSNKINSKFSFYSKIYAFTTENISGYYKNIDFVNKKILTICSSGDHVLNAILLGCKNIDCFDINIFTKYYMYLKVAAIKALNYSEFIEFFVSENRFRFDLYKKVSNYLDKDVKLFWDENYKNDTIFDVKEKLFIKCEYINTNINYNLYFNEEKYELLKYKLLSEDIKIKFIQSDILEIVGKVNKIYDYIFLSNIVDYLPNYYTVNFNKNYINYINDMLSKKIKCKKIYYCYIYNLDNKKYKVDDNIMILKFENGLILNQNDAVGIIDIEKK